MRIFLAGATGVIGRRLTPLLVLMGHEVTGTTRSAANAGSIAATGARGRRLSPLLVLLGHEVTGTTRSAAKAGSIEAMCGRPVIIDVFDADRLKQAAVAARPDAVIHQHTDLPDVNDPAKYAATREANARIRIEGTRNLMAAAKAAGVRRAIAQSVAFAYAPGAEPHHDADPLSLQCPGRLEGRRVG